MKVEHRSQPLLPQKAFLRRVAAAAAVSVALLTVWIIIGMLGYRLLADLSWVDAFLNAAMIVGGMGPVDLLQTASAKVFAGFYAIFSGVIFLGVFALLAAPIFHRFLHKFHLDIDEKSDQ